MKEIAGLLFKDEFPRSMKYDGNWMMDNHMGPNAIWLAEWLCEEAGIERGMRVLDLGCGKAISSIFIAKEFGAQVWAADLWIGPDNNFRRACEQGVGNLVYPVKAEAHSLPFPAGFFDAVISVDSYQYFGTDELYISYIGRFIKPGGFMGAAVPGLMRDIAGDVPAHLIEPQSNGKVFWDPECISFKTKAFWKRLWEASGALTGVKTETLKDGWRHWRDFENVLQLSGKNMFPSDAEALEKDEGKYIGFVKITGRRNSSEGHNLYDPSLGAVFGVDR